MEIASALTTLKQNHGSYVRSEGYVTASVIGLCENRDVVPKKPAVNIIFCRLVLFHMYLKSVANKK